MAKSKKSETSTPSTTSTPENPSVAPAPTAEPAAWLTWLQIQLSTERTAYIVVLTLGASWTELRAFHVSLAVSVT